MKNLNIIEKYNDGTSRNHYIKMVDGEYLAIKKCSEDPFAIENLKFEICSNIKRVIDYIARVIILSKMGKINWEIIIAANDDSDNVELLDSEVIMSLYNKKTTLSRFTYNTVKDIDELIEICRKK